MKKKLGNNGEPIESEEYRDIKFDEMKERPQPQEAWEDIFDLNVNYDEAEAPCNWGKDDIKSFIRTLLEAQKKEIIKEIEKTQGDCIKDPFDHEHEYLSKARIIEIIKRLNQ